MLTWWIINEFEDTIIPLAEWHLKIPPTVSNVLFHSIQRFWERLSYKSVKVNSTMSKDIMGNDGFTLDWLIDWSSRYFGVREGSSKNKRIHAFSFLLAKRREPQPSSAKLLLRIIPIGIVACAFVLPWDNLCRNNCTRGKGVVLTKLSTGRLRPEVQPLTLLYTILAEKVPLLYTFCWKKIPLSYTYFRQSCSHFHVVLNE